MRAICLLSLCMAARAFVIPTLVAPSARTTHHILRMSAAPPQPAAPGAAPPRPTREITVGQVVESTAGYIAKVSVKNFQVETKHTIVTSKKLMKEILETAEKPDVDVRDYYKAVIKFMLNKGMSLTNTEGMIDAGVFPVNYFSVGQLLYFYEDAVEGLAASVREL